MRPGRRRAAPAPLRPPRVSSLRFTRGGLRAPTPGAGLARSAHDFLPQRGSLARATRQDLGIKTPRELAPPEPEAQVSPAPSPPVGARRAARARAAGMTARGTPSRFLTSVLHNGLGRYVQQLQRLSFSLSRDAPSSRGAR